MTIHFGRLLIWRVEVFGVTCFLECRNFRTSWRKPVTWPFILYLLKSRSVWCCLFLRIPNFWTSWWKPITWLFIWSYWRVDLFGVICSNFLTGCLSQCLSTVLWPFILIVLKSRSVLCCTLNTLEILRPHSFCLSWSSASGSGCCYHY